MTRAALLTPELAALVAATRAELDTARLSDGALAAAVARARHLAALCTTAAAGLADPSAYGRAAALALAATAEEIAALAATASALLADSLPDVT